MADGKDIFEILMREHADMLLAFLRASVRDAHAVDDIFQETMVIAWRKLDQFDRQRSFAKWIRGIAGKLILAHYKTAGRTPGPIDAEKLEWMESQFAKIGRQTGETLEEKLELLRECVAALSTENRSAIEARYQKQLSLSEIVQTTGTALQTLKKRLYRAKAQLADCIDQKLLALENLS